MDVEISRSRTPRSQPLLDPFDTAAGCSGSSNWRVLHPLGELAPQYLLAILALGLFLWESRYPIQQADDAFISYRYARNLASGYGLVFNPGEYVEGYTSALWTLLVALGIKLGADAPKVGYLLGVVSGSLLLTVTCSYTGLFLRRENRWIAGLGPLSLLAFNCFACWTSAGLETPLFTTLTVLALRSFALRRLIQTSCWCILATMTRPEGVILASTLLGLDWCQRLLESKQPEREPLLRRSIPLVLYASYIILHTAFRLYYYEDALPNTFYAKVGGIPISVGVYYFRNFIVDGPMFLIPGFLAAAVLIKPFRVPFAYVVVTIAYTIVVGGDVFRLGRFLLPILPVMVAGAIAGAAVLRERRRVAGLLLALGVPLAMLWSLYSGWPPSFDFVDVESAPLPASAKRASARQHDFFGGIESAKLKVARIRALTPPVGLVATIGLGELGYYSGNLPILDLVGLVDRHIARSGRVVEGAFLLPGHSRTDADYVFSRKPDLIEIPRKGASVVPIPVIVDLWDNPRLEEAYYWDEHLGLYRRKP